MRALFFFVGGGSKAGPLARVRGSMGTAKSIDLIGWFVVLEGVGLVGWLISYVLIDLSAYWLPG